MNKQLLLAGIFTALLITQSFTATASIQQGIVAFHNNDYQQAKELLETEVSSNQTSEQLYHYLGRTSYLQGKLEDAESYFKKATDLNGKQSEHFY
jgi:Tfp pilus assembly protein PilF